MLSATNYAQNYAGIIGGPGEKAEWRNSGMAE